MKFSLFFFSDCRSVSGKNKYSLLLESARYSDANGFHAIWTPERHFSSFGGLYPNPSVIGAAIASITRHLQIRAGSVILPLHEPIRVAEDWSVVDNLSNGRVGLSFGRGWNPNDFVLAPANYVESREVMYAGIEVVRRLWRGEAIQRQNGRGESIHVSIFPRPIQKELIFWITAESDNSFVKAGSIGANVLTHLVLRTVSDLEKNIREYRQTLADNGYDPSRGCVTLMMHTFLSPDFGRSRSMIDEAYSRYIGNYLEFLSSARTNNASVEDEQTLKKSAVERLFESHGIVGSPACCVERVARLEAIGVDEIACLVDFGIDDAEVISGLSELVKLQRLVNSF